jgi:hypothetical protein
MKYMISWFERPQGSPAEYENAEFQARPVIASKMQSGSNSKPSPDVTG